MVVINGEAAVAQVKFEHGFKIIIGVVVHICGLDSSTDLINQQFISGFVRGGRD